MLHNNRNKLIRLLAITSAAIIFLFILKYTIAYIYPFFIAAALAMLLNPLVTYLETTIKFLNRSIATLFVMFSFFGLFSFAAYLFIDRIITELSRISANLPDKLVQLKTCCSKLDKHYTRKRQLHCHSLSIGTFPKN